MVNLHLILSCLIGIVSIVGDVALKYEHRPVLRAIFDNSTHALVGALSWSAIVVLSKKSVMQNLTQISICFFMSSFIDLDHFIAAKSWKLDVS